MPSRPDVQGRLVRLEVADVAVVVDLSEGARAVSWTVGGVELLGHRGDDPVEHGMYPMAPWAGRLSGNAVERDGQAHPLPATHGPWALHGTVLAQRGELVDETHLTDVARIRARFAEHAAWPWPMTVEIEWLLEPRMLTTTITVHALEQPFPVVVGWHPWFRRSLGMGGVLQWSLPAVERLVRGPDHLPTGERVPFSADDGPFDDAFAVPSGAAEVCWPGVIALDIASGGDWFVVFDEAADFVCVEPQSGPPDGLSSRLTGQPAVAAPSRPHVHCTQWRIRDLSA